MADTQIFKVRHQRRSAIEGHAIAKLKAIRCSWDHDADSPWAKRTIRECWESDPVDSFGQAKRVLPGKSGSNTVVALIFSASDSVPPGKRQLTAINPGAVCNTVPELSRAADNSGTICFWRKSSSSRVNASHALPSSLCCCFQLSFER